MMIVNGSVHFPALHITKECYDLNKEPLKKLQNKNCVLNQFVCIMCIPEHTTPTSEMVYVQKYKSTAGRKVKM